MNLLSISYKLILGFPYRHKAYSRRTRSSRPMCLASTSLVSMSIRCHLSMTPFGCS